MRPDRVIAIGGDRDDLAFARPDLLHIGNHLFINIRIRRDADNRAVLIDQRDRPVLHFAGGITFSRDIGDLFELQRAFQGRGKIDIAAQEKKTAKMRIALGDLGDRDSLIFQNLAIKRRESSADPVIEVSRPQTAANAFS